MKVTAIMFGLFAALAMAAPVADPEAAPIAEPEAAPVLEARQSWCGKCVNGARTCCTAQGCGAPISC